MTQDTTRDAGTQEMVCPTCRARQVWSETCRRCKSDLTLLRQIWQRAEWHRRQALHALTAGRPQAALAYARRYAQLLGDDRAKRLLAVCNLLCENWPQALRRC
jgi:hypothetical protein